MVTQIYITLQLFVQLHLKYEFHSDFLLLWRLFPFLLQCDTNVNNAGRPIFRWRGTLWYFCSNYRHYSRKYVIMTTTDCHIRDIFMQNMTIKETVNHHTFSCRMSNLSFFCGTFLPFFCWIDGADVYCLPPWCGRKPGLQESGSHHHSRRGKGSGINLFFLCID